MGQRKGQTGNPNGRPAGTPNRMTGEIRLWLKELIDGNRAQLEKDLQALDPKDRWQIVEKMMGYVVPKMQSVDAKVDLSTISEEQLSTVIDELLIKMNDEN